jgi:hypothetical protein
MGDRQMRARDQGTGVPQPYANVLNMKIRSALFWLTTILAGLIVLWVAWDYLYGLSEGFPVLNVHALLIAAVIWLLGFFFRRAF